MDALFALQATSGQVTHEALYGARWVWNNLELPCNHDGVMQNPPLMTGGFSPDTQTMVIVRRELFTGTLPKKGDKCFLVVNADNDSFALQVQTITTSPGDLFLNILCVDSNQGA